jgi:DNA-directed RNA polymerase specialized sigma24 family protein
MVDKDGLGFSHREVANQIGISEDASRQAYVRAKKSLMSVFSEMLPSNLGGENVAHSLS